MKKQPWPKRDPIKNYFPVPDEIYSLGVPSTAISVYSYLPSREDRKTYQCLASYRKIAEAIDVCVNTVRKYEMVLERCGNSSELSVRLWLPKMAVSSTDDCSTPRMDQTEAAHRLSNPEDV